MTETMAFDRIGGHEARRSKLNATAGINGTGLQFTGTKGESLTANLSMQGESTVSFWIHPKVIDQTNENDWRELVRTDRGSLLILEENGQISLRTPGSQSGRLVGGNVKTDEWTHVAATHNATHRMLYVDGHLVATELVTAPARWNEQIRFGSGFGSNPQHIFIGRIDEIRINGRALNNSTFQKRIALHTRRDRANT
jgi:hypothetical protein